MRNKIVKGIAVFMALYSLLSIQAFALVTENIQTLDESEAFVRTAHTSDLSVETGKYLYGADLLAQDGASSTYCSIVIQQKNSNGEYVDVPGTFRSDYQLGRHATVGATWYVYSGYWYRTQATYIVIKDNKEYKVVENSDQFWYPKK